MRDAAARALELKPEDPYIQALAGKIAYTTGDYAGAVKHLAAAVRDFPNLMEAHYTLANAYRALGETEKARAEIAEFRRIREEIREPGREMPPVGNVLFTVKRPRVALRGLRRYGRGGGRPLGPFRRAVKHPPFAMARAASEQALARALGASCDPTNEGWGRLYKATNRLA